MRSKNLTFFVGGLLLGSTTLPSMGQVRMAIEATKSYRQVSDKSLKFRGGILNLTLVDGSAVYTCDDTEYFPPSIIPLCPIGATGYLIQGNPDPDNPIPSGPYYSIVSLVSAIAIEPRREELIFLRAAPASTLPRPSGLFKDSSYTIYHNIRTADVREYTVCIYEDERGYNSEQQSKMQSDVVTGVYQFMFPRLGNPNAPIALSSTIYPMPDAYGKVRNRVQGVRFTKTGKFNNGFVTLDPNIANTISWEGLLPSSVYGIDRLYFAIRSFADPNQTDAKDPASNTSIFPAFVAPGEDRVLLPNPYVKKFVLPPGLLDVFQSGLKGVVQLTLERSLSTNGVTYDNSQRTFELPVQFSDTYKSFAKINFGKKKKRIGLFDDFDGDGFSNLEEWGRRTNPARASSTPPPLVIAAVPISPEFPDIIDYYGFTTAIRQDLTPELEFIFEQSDTANGPWTPLVSDPLPLTGYAVARTENQLSVVYNGPIANGAPTVQRFFRVRIVLAP